ncbi:MAG: DUF89 family protein [Clostridia bacterium]|nr:DUF89 family protein [Clostridia bacterium]
MEKRRMHPMCVTCLIKKQQEAVRYFIKDTQKQLEYMKMVCEVMQQAVMTDSPSLILYRMQQRASEFVEPFDLYKGEKERFNSFVLPEQEEIYSRILKSDDPLLTALLISMTGNYIDSGTVSNINKETLYEIMFDFKKLNCDICAYEQIRLKIEQAGKIVVLHDNCGEVVLDKLLIRYIKSVYPEKEVVSIVRGGNVLNDVTLAEARQVGLGEYSTVVSSGVAIAGTELDWVSHEALDHIKSADFIISKGQGNFETLCGCGLPIVYLFLCKCPLQCYRFNCNPLTGVMRLEDGVSFFDNID